MGAEEAGRLPFPFVRLPSPTLDEDLRAVVGSTATSWEDLEDRRIERVNRMPARVRSYLPEGVSERFLVTLGDDETVRYDVQAFSRGSHPRWRAASVHA